MSGNSTLVNACRRIQENDSSFTILNLTGHGIENDGVYDLCRAWQHNTHLVVVMLSYCCISDRGAQRLATTLPSSVRYLYLGHNDIGDQGASSIAQHLISRQQQQHEQLDEEEEHEETNNHSLQLLDLSNNVIGNEGATQIANALVSNNESNNKNNDTTVTTTTISSLRLDGNEIGVKGIVSFAQALEQMSDNNNNKKNNNLQQDDLNCCSGFHTLQLHGNPGGPGAYHAIRRAIRLNYKTLKTITLDCYSNKQQKEESRMDVQHILQMYHHLAESLRDFDLLPQYWPSLLSEFAQDTEFIHTMVTGRPDVIVPIQ